MVSNFLVEELSILHAQSKINLDPYLGPFQATVHIPIPPIRMEHRNNSNFRQNQPSMKSTAKELETDIRRIYNVIPKEMAIKLQQSSA